MATEFFAPAKYSTMCLPGDVSGVNGGIIFPSGIALHTLQRRKFSKYPHLARRLLDPQIYLSGLNAVNSKGTCANLVSYGWFNVSGIPQYCSSKQKQSDWKKQVEPNIHRYWTDALPTSTTQIEDSVRTALHIQSSVGCEALILPSPLTVDYATDYSRELVWLDAGLDMASTIAPNKPRYATIAISDSVLRADDPWQNHALDLIIDQVTARTPDGAYIVLETKSESGYYCTHPNTIGALLRLVHGLKVGGVPYVIVAFAGMAGLLALIVGADAWCTAWYRTERRMRMADCEDSEGRAMPAYYSHALASELHMENDLDRVCTNGLLERIKDVTPASEQLIRALRQKQPVSSVTDWRYSQSNVAASREHLLRVAVRETQLLSGITLAERLNFGLRWLEAAEELAGAIYALGKLNSRTEIGHQAGWLHALKSFQSHL